MKKSLMLIYLMISFSLYGCLDGGGSNTTGATTGTELSMSALASRIAELPTLDEKTVDDLGIINRINNLIQILNEHGDFEIPEIKTSDESLKKVSRVMNKYTPLVDNYNEVIITARSYQEGDIESERAFYVASAKFGFETFLICTAAFGPTAYKSVGYVYRSSGLNKLAFKYPNSVRVVLGNGYALLNKLMVEGTADHAADLLESVISLVETKEGFEDIRSQLGEGYNKSAAFMDNVAEETGPVIEGGKNITTSAIGNGLDKVRPPLEMATEN